MYSWLKMIILVLMDYLIRGYNVERINEGTIESMINEGYMIKLVKRAKTIKEGNI